jgi:hypothetical protein
MRFFRYKKLCGGLATNSKGATLVELVVVAGIIAIVAVGFSSFLIEQQKTTNHVQSLFEAITLQQGVIESLANPLSCALNFAGRDPNTAFAAPNIQKIIGGAPSVVFETNPPSASTYGNGFLAINEILFGEPGTNAGPNPNTSLVVPLRLHFRKVKSSVGGDNLPHKTIQVYARTDAAGLIVSCSTDRFGTFTDELLAPDGYIVFPNGLIMQWGSSVAPANSMHTFNYPRAFPNAVFSAVVSGTQRADLDQNDNPPVFWSTTLTTMTVKNGTDQNAEPFRWFAVGR